ncbi:hypothetical protein H0H92_004114 [Tricholoma furcatifolium]|nr:hypothetical protein H0H92_004114 [Tricholoma furcatifolium]
MQSELFPWEVQDLIIDGLQGDRVSLHTCSLVSPRWLKHVRMISDLTSVVSVGPGKAGTQQFIALLNAPHSTLGYGITRLEIDMDEPSAQPKADYEFISAAIQAIAPYLPRIKSLSLTNAIWSRVLDAKVPIDAITSSITSLSFEHLVFNDFIDIKWFSTQRFPRLKVLTFLNVQFETVETSRDPVLIDFPRIHTLTLGLDGDFMPFPICRSSDVSWLTEILDSTSSLRYLNKLSLTLGVKILFDLGSRLEPLLLKQKSAPGVEIRLSSWSEEARALLAELSKTGRLVMIEDKDLLW